MNWKTIWKMTWKKSAAYLALVLAFALAPAASASYAALCQPISDVASLQQEQQHETPTNSVTGKVVKISQSQLTLEPQGDTASAPIDFDVDSNTKIDGKVQPGDTVSVDYRTDGDKKIATHVMPAKPANPPSSR
ncbi:MAG: hypothetical protein WA755_08810 [Candidatus Acidiferrales bacterium]